MPLLVAHAASLLLAMLDIAARAWRYVLLLRGLQATLSMRGALALTAFGDAVAAITPMRLGGEPARILGAKHDGVPVGRAVVALALENVLTYAILIPTAAVVATRYGKDWWHTIAPTFDLGLLRWLVIATLTAALVGVFVAWRRLRHRRGDLTTGGEGFRRLVADLFSFPLWLLLRCVLLSAVSLAARVAILPVLASATPQPPSLGVLTVASLGLLYGQLFVPTPSGAGPIDVAVLGGATGISTKAGALLGAWRLYTSILPIVAGFAAGALAYGRTILSLIPRRD